MAKKPLPYPFAIPVTHPNWPRRLGRESLKRSPVKVIKITDDDGEAGAAKH